METTPLSVPVAQPVTPKEKEKTRSLRPVSAKVSLKTSLSILGTYAVLSLFVAVPFIQQMPFDVFNASIIGESNLETLHEAAPIPFLNASFTALLISIAAIFMSIFTLYIFAKAEGQEHGEAFHKNSCKYSYQNFPSIFVIEALTMLYVLLITVACIAVITKISFSNVESLSHMDTDIFNIISSMIFAVLGGALSQLYYFLNKVEPDDAFDEATLIKKGKNLEFDINRTLRYLSFPFMSAGMGIMAYTIIKGSGLIVGIEAFQNPSYWAIVFIALSSGYFSDLFTVTFQKIISKMETKILNGKDEPVKA